MKKVVSILTTLFIIVHSQAQYVNQDSLLKAEMQAEKKLYNTAKVRVILIGLPYMAATTGVNLRVANFSNKIIKYAYVSVKGIDTSQQVVGTEICKMKGPIKPQMEMEEDFGTLFYLTEMERYEIIKITLDYTDGTKWTVPHNLLSKVCILHKSQQEIDDKVRAAMENH
jgi:hypothetical protein